MSPAGTRIVVLISGGGTNLQAILDATRDHEIPGIVAAVISNRPDVQGLRRATEMGVPAEVLDHRGFATREDFDLALMKLIDGYEPDLIVLAGFMRILGAQLVGHYAGRMLNIHPSLLPAYRGLHTHARALADGAREHGASVHFVTPDLDGGPVIIQARVPVLKSDTPETLAARVLEQEHVVYPLAVRWFCEGRLRLRDATVELDGRALERPIRLDELEPAVGAP